MFTQADRALDPAQGGLGIGLTLVKRLVEMHGGTVEGKSEGPGQGSEFVVRLPLAAEPAPPPALVQQPAVPVVPPSALRILVVDDNPDSADSLAALLAIPGNQVRVAYDGLDGVDARSGIPAGRGAARSRPAAASTATRWPSGFESSRGARRWSSSRSPAGGRTKPSSSRRRSGSTSTS